MNMIVIIISIRPVFGGMGPDGKPQLAHLPILRDLDLRPRDGELVLVCGAVGVGKSSLLMALLGELTRTSGEAHFPPGPVAYQPQEPWLMKGTIRDNVLFGVPDGECNEEHLRKALRASQLSVDMENPRNTLHAEGQNTMVGVRGYGLSGGQRARCALARSVYAALQGASLVLLDDPVASVDNEVVQAAWRRSVLEAMKDVTRVVVVNTQLLERLALTADRLVVVKDGGIAFDGSPAAAAQDPSSLNAALGGSFELVPPPTADDGEEGEGEERGQKAAAAGCGELAKGAEPSPAGEVEPANPGLALVDLLHECAPLRRFVDEPAFGAGDEAAQGGAAAAHLMAMAPSDWAKLRRRLRALEAALPKAEGAGNRLRGLLLRRRSNKHTIIMSQALFLFISALKYRVPTFCKCPGGGLPRRRRGQGQGLGAVHRLGPALPDALLDAALRRPRDLLGPAAGGRLLRGLRREPKGVLLEGGLHLYDLSLINLSNC